MERLVAILAPISLLTACAGSGPYEVHWEAERLHASNVPEAYQRLAVRTVTIEPAPVASLTDSESYSIDPHVARGALVQTLAASGLVRQVIPSEFLPLLGRSQPLLGGDGRNALRRRSSTDGAGSAPRVASDATPELFQEPASALVLDLLLRNASFVHAGENEDASRAFWAWLFGGPCGLAVRSEVFEIGYETLARVSDARTGEVLVDWETIAPLRSYTYALNFHERTSGVLPYLEVDLIPPSAIDSDPETVLRKILPHSFVLAAHGLRSLVQDRIAFVPVNRFEIQPAAATGLRIEEVLAPIGIDVVGSTIDLTVIVTFDKRAGPVRSVRVGGLPVDDAEAVTLLPGDDRAEFRLRHVSVDRTSVAIEVVLSDREEPESLLTLRAVPTGDVRAIRK